MITPSFSCSQTSTSVIASIYVPSVRASEVEIHVEGTLLSVFISPYFLRLNFPGRVVEDDASSAKYDPGTGFLAVTLTKAVPNEDFPDLDILAKLLGPVKKDRAATSSGIEVLDSTAADSAKEEEDLVENANKLSLEDRELAQAAENDDWQIPQTVPPLVSGFQTSNQRYYGFLNLHTGYFKHVGHTENEVNELGEDAETILVHERRSRRLAHEDTKWDEEHYMADFADDECIQELIGFTFPSKAPAYASEGAFEFTDAELATMLKLPRREYLTNSVDVHNLYLTLLTILFSYAYDARTTQYEPTAESAWTICSLTPAFSALDPPPYSDTSTDHTEFSKDELQSTMAASIRRSLAFPLYRSFALAESCVRDVAAICINGKRAVFRALLEAKDILDHHDVYYVFSKIWLDDFCGWVVREGSDETLSGFGRQLKSLSISKKLIGWDIEELEEAVRRETERPDDSDDESE